MVFVAVPWCGLGVIRFRSAMLGLLWGWLVVDGHKATKKSKCFFLAEVCEFGGSVKRMF